MPGRNLGEDWKLKVVSVSFAVIAGLNPAI